MINSRFFIDNSEVIGLWMLFAIVMWLAVCIMDLVFDCIKSKMNQKRQQKDAIVNRRRRITKDIEKVQYQNWLYNFNKSFEQIINFEI